MPEQVEYLSEFGRQLAALLTIAGPWEQERQPTFADLLAQAVARYDAQATALAAATARAEAAEAEVATLLAEVVDGAKPSVVEDHTLVADPGFYQFCRGMNAAKDSFLRWARSKALDKGLAWPLPEAFFGYNHTNEDGTKGQYWSAPAASASPVAGGVGEGVSG